VKNKLGGSYEQDKIQKDDEKVHEIEAKQDCIGSIF